jgi:hypothetical protein
LTDLVSESATAPSLEVDGFAVNRISTSFKGKVDLDLAGEEHVRLISTQFGDTVTLHVEAIVGPPTPSIDSDSESEIRTVLLSRALNVAHVYPSPSTAGAPTKPARSWERR